MGGSFRGF